MEIKWCEDFLCLAKHGNFSKAAKKRFVTQSAFSRRIQSLERWLGVHLVNRDSYPITLTNEGVKFKEIAEEIVSQLYTVRNSFQNKEHISKLDITFASLDSLSTSFFPGWLGDLNSTGPIPATQLLQNNLKECVNLLEQGDCDFVLCYAHQWATVPLEQKEYTSIKIASEKLLPVRLVGISPYIDQALPKSSEELIEFLAYSPDCFLGQITEVALEKIKNNIKLKTVYENSTATSLKVMVEHGYGFAWLPERLINKELSRKELYIIPEYNIIPPLEIRLYRAKRKKRSVVERFWNKIQLKMNESDPNKIDTETYYSDNSIACYSENTVATSKIIKNDTARIIEQNT